MVEPRAPNGRQERRDLAGHGAGRIFYYNIIVGREIKREILA